MLFTTNDLLLLISYISLHNLNNLLSNAIIEQVQGSKTWCNLTLKHIFIMVVLLNSACSSLHSLLPACDVSMSSHDSPTEKAENEILKQFS